MEIAGLHNQSLQQLYKKQIERATSPGSVAGQQNDRQRSIGDSVELSTNAQLLHRVLQELNSDNNGSTSTQRLDRLHRQVQDGSYEVSLQTLADRLFSELL